MKAMVKVEDNKCLVSGSLNFSTVPEVWNDSLPLLSTLQTLTFDFSKVTSSNSAGVTLLIEWLKYAKKKEKNIEFINIPESMMSLAKVSGVDHLIA